jgi:hypothetical protein
MIWFGIPGASRGTANVDEGIMRKWMVVVVAGIAAVAVAGTAEAQTKKQGAKPKADCGAQVNARFGNNLDPQTRRMRAAAFQRCQQGQPI